MPVHIRPGLKWLQGGGEQAHPHPTACCSTLLLGSSPPLPSSSSQVLASMEKTLDSREVQLQHAWKAIHAKATKMRVDATSAAAAALVTTRAAPPTGRGGSGSRTAPVLSATDKWRHTRQGLHLQRAATSGAPEGLLLQVPRPLGKAGVAKEEKVEEEEDIEELLCESDAFVEEISVLLEEAAGGKEPSAGEEDAWQLLEQPGGWGGSDAVPSGRAGRGGGGGSGPSLTTTSMLDTAGRSAQLQGATGAVALERRRAVLLRREGALQVAVVVLEGRLAATSAAVASAARAWQGARVASGRAAEAGVKAGKVWEAAEAERAELEGVAELLAGERVALSRLAKQLQVWEGIDPGQFGW